MNKELKIALFDLMHSHSILAQAEYQGDCSYNSSHFSYKAEENMIKFLNENHPGLFDIL